MKWMVIIEDQDELLKIQAFLKNGKNKESHRGIGGPAEDKVEQNDSSPSASFIHSVGSVAPLPSPKSKALGMFMCDECMVPITDKEKDYSEKWYSKSLCRKHQAEYKKRRESIENATGPGDIWKY